MQSQDSENVQHNLKIAQILRLRRTYILVHVKWHLQQLSQPTKVSIKNDEENTVKGCGSIVLETSLR